MIYSALSICKVWSSKHLPRWKRRALVAAMVKRNRAAERALRESESRRRRKPRNSHRNRGYAIKEMGRRTEEMFVRMLRLDRASFDELVARLEPLIARDAVKAIASSGSEIPTRTRLAVTLRWLAGGQHLDICFSFGVSKSSFYSDRGVLWPTIEAIDRLHTIGFPLDDADTIEE
ncbi:hypothetical protein B484DRAFT_453659 [Ochromonadaceae sp. CCMP2298]|nr:hypothetical protein B484DRAFT_453659 [Ochromonadaceae sp. CCMP2298]